MTNVDDVDDEIDEDADDQNLNNDTDTDEDDDTTSDDDSGDTSDDDSDDSDSDQGADDGDEDDSSDSPAASRAKTQIDRLKIEKKYYKDLAEGKKPAKPDWLKDNSASRGKKLKADDATLARLEIRGVMDPADQEYVIKYAKSEGISEVDALNEDVVKDRLTKNKRIREQRGSNVTPNNRVGAGANPKSVDYWIRKGQLPADPELAEKVQDELAKRAKHGR
jgi:hypothetical protein